MGRGSSGIGAGRGSSNANTKAGSSQPTSGWREDYNRALEESERYRQRAEAMDAEVKAAKDAYYKAPTRSKAQKAEAARLENEMDRLTMEQSMLRYRAAQLSSFAENLRMENDTRYRNRRNRSAAANARRGYR